ncbi:MAG: hypothetical protein RR326_10155 [Stenotrophomonas sp.]
MPDPSPSLLPVPPQPALQADDALAVASYGAELLAAIEQLLGTSQTGIAAARLVAEMDNIRQAMSAADGRQIRRSVGLLGRLLGRDVEAQARAEQLAGQLDVCLLRADACVQALQKELGQHLQQIARVQMAVAAIDGWAAAGEAVQPPAEVVAQAALQRRLQHLRGLARLRQTEAEQLRLLHAQGVELIERYQRIRDVLLPLWRQQSLAARAADKQAQLEQAAEAQTRILDEVRAMQARLR